MRWQNDYQCSLKVTVQSLQPDYAVLAWPEGNLTFSWPRAKLPTSLQTGDEFLLAVICEETREMAKASVRRDILNEIMN